MHRNSLPHVMSVVMPMVQVRWWDVTQGQQISRLKGHTDYVRAAGVHPLDSNTWATGEARCGSCACRGMVCNMKVLHSRRHVGNLKCGP